MVIGDFYRGNFGYYYVVVKETEKTKTLMRFVPYKGDFVSKYSDPCNRDIEIRGVEYYLEEYVTVRLTKGDKWKYKKDWYLPFTLPFYDHTYID